MLGSNLTFDTVKQIRCVALGPMYPNMNRTMHVRARVHSLHIPNEMGVQMAFTFSYKGEDGVDVWEPRNNGGQR